MFLCKSVHNNKDEGGGIYHGGMMAKGCCLAVKKIKGEGELLLLCELYG